MRLPADALAKRVSAAARTMRPGRLSLPALALGALLPLVLPLLATGCSSGIRWAAFAFDERVRQESRSSGKPTFVYFRSWYAVECTRFEDNVLSHPGVRQATAGFYCVTLDLDADRELAARWKLDTSPAYALLQGGEPPRITRNGAVTLETLLSDLQSVRQATTGPAPVSGESAAGP